MKRLYCKDCKSKHFLCYACSECGQEFSAVYPTIKVNNSYKTDKIKYCPRCGHEFKPIKQES